MGTIQPRDWGNLMKNNIYVVHQKGLETNPFSFKDFLRPISEKPFGDLIDVVTRSGPLIDKTLAGYDSTQTGTMRPERRCHCDNAAC